MKVQNIIIEDDKIIIVNSEGGQHHIYNSEVRGAHRTWVDNIKACAASLMNDYEQKDNFELQDWQNTLLDGLDELDGFDGFADELFEN